MIKIESFLIRNCYMIIQKGYIIHTLLNSDE